MATYFETANYFENLCENNLLVKHKVNGKKFFRMDIQELLTGVSYDLPSHEDGPFVIFINYMSEIDFKGRPRENKQFMLFFLRGFPHNDFEEELISRKLSEQVASQFLRKFKIDSIAGNSVFERSFDVIKAKTPAEILANGKYVGWQVTFDLVNSFNECIEETNWKPQD